MNNSTNDEVTGQFHQKEILDDTEIAKIHTSNPEEPGIIPPAESAQPTGNSMENLMDLYEESFKRFQEGEVVTGRIISLDKDYVSVDIGYKSEGQIRIQEFMDDTGNISASVGDVVEVMVEWWDDDEEIVVLSKEKAASVKVWEEIRKAYEKSGTVQGDITHRVKGGFSVDIGVTAFFAGFPGRFAPHP